MPTRNIDHCHYRECKSCGSFPAPRIVRGTQSTASQEGHEGARKAATPHPEGRRRLRHEAAPEWQAAMEALILVAETAGPTMLARIGVMRALNRHVERVLNPDRKETDWDKRKLKRDQ